MFFIAKNRKINEACEQSAIVQYFGVLDFLVQVRHGVEHPLG